MEATTSASVATKYPVHLYTDTSIPTAGHRMSVIRWKVKKGEAEGKKLPTVYVNVPDLRVQDFLPSSLSTALKTAVEDMQDSIIRATIVTEHTAGTPLTAINIPASSLSYEGIAAWAAQQAISNRLSGDLITAWFNANLREPLLIAILTKNADLEEDKLNAMVAKYRETIVSLASPRTSLNEQTAQVVLKALSLVEDSDKVHEQLTSKVELFLKPREQVILEGL